MEELLGIGASAVAGSGLGIIGSILGRGLGIWERKVQLQETKLKYAHELELLREQRAAKKEETEQEIDLANVHGSWGSLDSSIQSDIAIKEVPKWVNACRAMVRVVLTPLLWVMTMIIFVMLVRGDMSNYLQTGDVFYLISYIVKSVVFSAANATAWWFGDRAPKPRDY